MYVSKRGFEGLWGGWFDDLLVGAVSEVVHDDAECHCLVWLAKYGLLIIRDQSHVVEQVIEGVEQGGIWEGLLVVVDKPPRNVIVQIFWVTVE
jgi:hypothetical protein